MQLSTSFCLSAIPVETLCSICENTLKKDLLFINYPSPFLRELCTRMIIRCFPIGEQHLLDILIQWHSLYLWEQLKTFLISGELIYRKGDVGTGMYLILIGNVKICADSRGSKIIHRFSAGTPFGNQFLMKRTLFKDTAIAENYVDVAILSKESFEAVGLLYPSIMRKLLKEASSNSPVHL